MHNIILLLDVVLIATGLWMIYVVRQSGLGGVIGSTLNIITFGALFLGLAHIIETAMIEVFMVDIEITELVHRIIVFAGFALLIVGFRNLAKLRAAT